MCWQDGRISSDEFQWCRVQGMIDRAVAEGRDVTTAEVQAELDATQKELDATAEAISNMADPETPA